MNEQVKFEIPTLQTDRLILRPLKIEDATDNLQYIQNPNVTQFTMWDPFPTIEHAQGFIHQYVFANYAQGAPEPLGIALKSDPKKLIGTTGCFWIKQPTQMELAYVLAEEYWGQGLAHEASLAVIDYCFSKFTDLVRIQARVKSGNDKSLKVLEKLNMQYEGTLRSQYFHRNQHWDILYYSMLRKSWISKC